MGGDDDVIVAEFEIVAFLLVNGRVHKDFAFLAYSQQISILQMAPTMRLWCPFSGRQQPLMRM